MPGPVPPIPHGPAFAALAPTATATGVAAELPPAPWITNQGGEFDARLDHAGPRARAGAPPGLRRNHERARRGELGGRSAGQSRVAPWRRRGRSRARRSRLPRRGRSGVADRRARNVRAPRVHARRRRLLVHGSSVARHAVGGAARRSRAQRPGPCARRARERPNRAGSHVAEAARGRPHHGRRCRRRSHRARGGASPVARSRRPAKKDAVHGRRRPPRATRCGRPPAALVVRRAALLGDREDFRLRPGRGPRRARRRRVDQRPCHGRARAQRRAERHRQPARGGPAPQHEQRRGRLLPLRFGRTGPDRDPRLAPRLCRREHGFRGHEHRSRRPPARARADRSAGAWRDRGPRGRRQRQSRVGCARRRELRPHLRAGGRAARGNGAQRLERRLRLARPEAGSAPPLGLRPGVGRGSVDAVEVVAGRSARAASQSG